MSQPANTAWSGAWTAIATPFTQSHDIAWDTFDQLLERQVEAGITGVVVCGTTGESPALSAQEKISLIRRAHATLNGRIRLMAGTGGNNTPQSVELSVLARDGGADSLLIVTPPYNKPSTAGLVAHYQAIAEAAGLPICLYHVPGRTGQQLTPDQVAAVAAVDQVACVKEASADMAFFSRAKMASQSIMLSGDDPTLLASLAIGGAGSVSVISNLFPAAWVDLIRSYNEGQRDRALAIHEALMPAIDVMFCESNPGPLKAAMAHLGLCENTLRPPLASVEPSNLDLIIQTVDRAKATLQTLEIK